MLRNVFFLLTETDSRMQYFWFCFNDVCPYCCFESSSSFAEMEQDGIPAVSEGTSLRVATYFHSEVPWEGIRALSERDLLPVQIV